MLSNQLLSHSYLFVGSIENYIRLNEWLMCCVILEYFEIEIVEETGSRRIQGYPFLRVEHLERGEDSTRRNRLYIHAQARSNVDGFENLSHAFHAFQGSDGQALQQVARHGQDATVRMQSAQRPLRPTSARTLPAQRIERGRNPRSDIVRHCSPHAGKTQVRPYWTAWRSTQRRRIRHIALQTRDGA